MSAFIHHVVGVVRGRLRNRHARNQVVMEMNGTDMTQIGPAVGAAFPDFQLPDASGQAISFHAWRAGRPALVVFYRSAKW